MEAVCIVFLIRDVGNDAEFLCVHAAEAIGQAFARSRVDAEMVTVLVAPSIRFFLHLLDDVQSEGFCFRIRFPICSVENGSRFIQSDISQRDCSAFVFE